MNLLLAALLTRTVTPPAPSVPPEDAYHAIVSAITKPRISWWRLGEGAGAEVAVDEEGTQNLLYQGGVTLGQAGLPSGSDDSVLLNGTTAYLEGSDHLSYHLASGEITGFLRTGASLANDQWFVGKDAGGLVADDLGFWYRASDDSLRLQLETAAAIFRATVNGDDVTIPTGVLATNTTYFWSLVFGTGGMRLYLASGGAINLVASSSYTGGLTSNTRNWRFGASQFTGTAANFFGGGLDEIIIWGEQLTDAERASLALAGPPPPAGTISEEILDRTPTLYWPLTSVAATDASPNGLDGTINGTLASAGEGGMDLGGTADISLAHNSLFETDPAPTTVDQDSYSEVGICAKITVNTLVNNTALVSKCDNTAAFALGWYAEAMADGRVRCHYISHRDNDLVIDAPAGTITQGVEFSLWMGLGYEGAWAAINGRMLWSGYKCPLHWYGDDHRVRDIVAAGRNHGGSRKVNQSTFRVGKIGSSGTRGDITVRHVALFYRDDPDTQMTIADAQTIAEVSGAALPHPIWGASTTNVANGATAATAQTAIDARSAAGGGTVRLASGGSYTWTSAVTVKDGVLLDLNGATVTMSGASLLIGTLPTISSITDNGGDIAAGATSVTGSNIAAAVSPGDCLVFIQSQFIDAFAFNGTEALERVTEAVEVKSVSGSTVNFKQPVVFPYSSANRASFRTATGDASVWRWTPPHNLGVVNGTVTKTDDQPIIMQRANMVLVADLNVRQTSAATQNWNALRVHEIFNLWSPHGFFVRNAATELGGSWHVYTYITVGYARGCVLHGAEFYNGGIPGWHAVSHGGINRLPGVDTNAIPTEIEYVNCHADCAERLHVWDSHYEATRVRFIDCSVKPTATGVSGTAGTPNGGGFLLDGYQHEILRFVIPATGKANHFRGQDGEGQCYVRDMAQKHPTDTRYWFTGGGHLENNTFVNVTRVDTSAAVPATPLMSDEGGNVFVNVDAPHP